MRFLVSPTSLKNGENGMYYPVGYFSELAKVISNCLDNLEKSKLMSYKAIETANLYSIREMEEKIYETIG